MDNSLKNKGNMKHWRSLDEYSKTVESAKESSEFAEGVTDNFDPSQMNGLSRRKFLALLTASAAFTAAACSDYQDKGEIIPYTDRPERLLPGKPNFYASSVRGYPVLVRTREGRPINIEGNPDHPIQKGKIDAKTTSSILNLYDPERLKNPTKDKRRIEWADADTKIISALNSAKGSGKEIALISHKITSPAELKLIAELKAKFPSLKHYSYDLFNESSRKNAWEKCFGNTAIPSVKWNKADVIVSLESDFLGREGNTAENNLLYSETRDILKSSNFSRLYAVEGGMSLTGMNADYRIRIRPDYQLDFALYILSKISNKISFGSDSVSKLLSNYNPENFLKANSSEKDKINYLIDDLLKYKFSALVHAGNTLSEDVHIVVNLINTLLGNDKLFDFNSTFVSSHSYSTSEEFTELIGKMNSGKVGVVIHYGTNPVFHFSNSTEYTTALKNAGTVISLSEDLNETTDLSNYVLPLNNDLESWGDSKTRSNVHDFKQPVIAPLFSTRQKEGILLSWIKQSLDEGDFHQYLINHFETEVYSKQNVMVDAKTYWYKALHDGFVQLKEKNNLQYQFDFSPLNGIALKQAKSDEIVLHLQPSYFVEDGSLANNGWLQEIPHPISKVAWDNYAAISPAVAKKLNVENNDYITINDSKSELKIPVMIQPGMAENLIVIELGYGRSVCGDVGKDVGFNANGFLSDSSNSKWIVPNISVSKASGSYKLVSTQEHHSLDDEFVKDVHRKRNIIQDGTLKEFKSNPKFLHEGEVHLEGITREHKYEGVKWGMSIDLNKCTSCSNCVAACNVENNVPVVGKDQVEVGREMHWIRLDRYYSGTPEDPIVSNQPMLCQHCDNAPCENVCPVNATNHSPDGLNQMAYNRCVGTRYCANNCPYKVRRFNFFDFRDHFEDAYYKNELTELINNPEVTVRSRGVMEKCTFCVQRIMEAKSEAIKDGRDLKGSDVTTACQSACPSQAIVFGDINDKDSELNKYREHELGYHVLEELFVKPNVTYLAKLRNTHSEEA